MYVFCETQKSPESGMIAKNISFWVIIFVLFQTELVQTLIDKSLIKYETVGNM